MTIERTEPSTTADERAMLEGWLDYHRATLIEKCSGLTDAQLRTASLAPSELTLMGLVRHLSENEQYWFQVVGAGAPERTLYCSEEDEDGDFRVTDQDTWAEALKTWQGCVEGARRAVSSLALDDLSVVASPSTGRHYNLRWILTHMIEEYARHNGHADLVREHIDGATGA